MKFTRYAVLAAMLIPVPAQAADRSDVQFESRVGAFVGARVKLRFGGPDAGRAQTSLAIAPTHSTYSRRGEIRTRMREGLAFEFSPRETPRATLAGMPVKQILGMSRSNSALDENRLGISTGGWVAIGVGVTALAGAVWFVSEMNKCEDHDDEC